MVLFLKFQRTMRKREIEMRGSETEAETKEREGRRVFVLAVSFCLITFQVSDAVSDFLYNVVPYATKIQ